MFLQAREKMVGAISNIQMDSVTTVQQTSAALQSLLSTPDEVSPNAQVSVFNLQRRTTCSSSVKDSARTRMSRDR